MSEPVYKVVVVGMGKRGKHHAAAFHANPRFEVAGICDIDTARLEAAAKELGNPAIGTDAAALVKDVKPDVFCFATLPNLRYDLVKIGVDSGAKLIAYEKPVALSTHEALQIMNLVRKAGVKTVVSHQHRYGVHYAEGQRDHRQRRHRARAYRLRPFHRLDDAHDDAHDRLCALV